MLLARTKFAWLLGLAIAGLLTAGSVQAQPPGQGPGRGGFGGFGGGFGGGGFGGGGPTALLQRNDVQEELELLDDQKSQLRALAEKGREQMGEIFRRGNRDGGERPDFREALRKFNEETQAEVDKILLPHQSKRLKQIEVQMRMRGGILGALGGDVAEDLGISEDQREKLREKAEGLEQELRKKVGELRRQMQEQLLADLSPDQRNKFKDMVGEPFEFRDEPGGPGGFRGRGGDGNRGGEGRGEGRGDGNRGGNRGGRPRNND